MEQYSATERSEIMPLAATGMALETLILSEVSHIGRDEYHLKLLTCRL